MALVVEDVDQILDINGRYNIVTLNLLAKEVTRFIMVEKEL